MKTILKVVGTIVKWYLKLTVLAYAFIGLGGYFNKVEDEDEAGAVGWDMVYNAHMRNWNEAIDGCKRFWKNNFAKKES